MTTVAQLATYLATLPQDAEVMVLEEYTRHWETSTRWVTLELGDCTDTMMQSSDGRTVYLGDG